MTTREGVFRTEGWSFNVINSMIIAFAILLFSSSAYAGGILWFGAHPDDEGAVAAVMAKYCTTTGEPGKYPCRMVVMTKGGGGNCEGLPQNPPPCPTTNHVKATRAGEMQDAALYLHSSLVQWDFSNERHAGTWDEPIARWSNQVQFLGGLNAIKTAIKNEIGQFNPDIILTFDPRHGTTCHQEHRSIGALVTVAHDEMKAAFGVNYPAALAFVESGLWEGRDSNGELIWLGNKRLVDGDTKVTSEDVSTFLPNYGKTAWEAAIEEAQIHQSQMDPQYTPLLPLFSNAPQEAQKVFFLDRTQAAVHDSLYGSLCPAFYN
jgi:LmbE family N-acetylglucosaminyl deacetylase